MHIDQEAGPTARERIVALASAQIRKSGMENLHVAKLMRAAGLTHGGFYHHFTSREELLDRAVIQAIKGSIAHWRGVAKGAAPGEAVRDVVACYLSARHFLDVAGGCPLPTLASEVSRSSATARKALADGVNAMIALLMEPNIPPASATREEAIATLSMIVGAVLLARSANDVALADEILVATRCFLSRDAAMPQIVPPIAPDMPRKLKRRGSGGASRTSRTRPA